MISYQDWDLDDLLKDFEFKYVDKDTDEPLKDLLLIEINYLLDNICYSQNKRYDKFIKSLLLLHCYGFKDKEISDCINDFFKKYISYDTVKKIRQRALDKMKARYGYNIGLITVINEEFRVNCIPDLYLSELKDKWKSRYLGE